MTMKKRPFRAAAVITVLAVSLAVFTACGSKADQQTAPADPEAAAASVTQEAAPEPAPEATPSPTPETTPTPEAAPDPEDTASAGMADPWKETADKEEAEKGSGIRFSLPVQEALPRHGDGEMRFWKYRWMTGTLETLFESVNDEMRIRISLDTEGEALTGDYTDYSQTWDESIKGLTVHCSGSGTNISNACFDAGDLHYAILYNAGMEGSGLTPDELNSLLMGMQASKYMDSAAEPEPAASLPAVTADPTDESVTEGASCLYIAAADGADTMEWRAVSPDGSIDVPYSEIGTYFSSLGYSGEYGEYLSLSSIPKDFSGWGSYCRFVNSAGSADSGKAVTYVQELPAAGDASSYMGTYAESAAGRGTMSVTGDPSFAYVTVTWAGSAWESSEWTFSGPIDGRGILEYSNCLKTVTTFDENGEGFPVLDYNYGTGYIRFTDSGVIWSDDQEHVADGTTFVKY